MAAGLFLTAIERARLQSFPAEIGSEDLAAFFMLSEADLVEVMRGRGEHNRLGLAVTICAVRYLGFIPGKLKLVPVEARRFVAEQLNCSPDLRGYPRRARTRGDHAARAMLHLGFRRATEDDLVQLDSWLTDAAGAHWRPSVLLAQACEELLRRRIMRPGISVLERMVLRSRQEAELRAYESLQLSTGIRTVLDGLLVVDEELAVTRLVWLRTRAQSNSPRAIKVALKKHAWLVQVGVTALETGDIHPNRLRHLARLGRTAKAQMLRRMPDRRRYSVLVAYLRQSLVDITDELLDLFGQCLAETQARARRDLLQHRQTVERTREDVVRSFVEIAQILSDSDVPDSGLRGRIHDSIPKEEVERLLEACKGPARPLDPEGLDFLRSKYRYLRQFSAKFLGQMEISGDEPDTAVLEAVRVVREANDNPRRPLPASSPTDFVPKSWRPFVLTDLFD